MYEELRVHGVSGTPPRDMLYTDPITRDILPLEGTNSYAKVFKATPRDEDFNTQAFHWGGLTAGSRLTAFWILLAPFAFANVAGWMSKDRSNKFAHAMIRAAGLGLTALFVCQAFTSLVLLPYMWLDRQGSFQILSREIEVGDGLREWAFLVLVIVLTGAYLLLLLKASTQSHFEPADIDKQSQLLGWPTLDAMDPKPKTKAEGEQKERQEKHLIQIKEPRDWEDPIAATITDPRLWRPYHSILTRLRRLHLAVGYAVVALEVALWTDTQWAKALAGVLILLISLATILITYLPERGWVVMFIALSPVAGVIVWTATLVTIFIGRVPVGEITSPHILTFMTALVMGVFVALSLRAGLISIGAFVLAIFSGAVLGLAVGFVIESMLGIAPSVLEENGAAWVSIAMLGLIVWLVITVTWLSWSKTPQTAEKGVWALIRRVVLQGPKLFKSAAIYGLIAGAVAWFLALSNQVWEPGVLAPPAPKSPIYDIAIFAGIFLIVFLALRVWHYFGWKFAPLVLLGAGLLVLAAYRDFFVIELLKVQIAVKGNLVDIAVAIAIIIPGGFLLKSIWTGVGSNEAGQRKRRSVGILWDMGSFWPRWYHPLAPPGYGPIAVTQLRNELESNNRHVVGAHSQGSLITAVALTFTQDDLRPRRLVTYGSQLGILYPQLFPGAGIGGEDGLVARLHAFYGERWVNLYRETDPIGGHYVDILEGQNRCVRVGTGHSGYEPTPEYREARSK
jgi:hypothetical protein